MIKNKELYSHFEDLAQKLDLKILKGKGDFIGGTCAVSYTHLTLPTTPYV